MFQFSEHAAKQISRTVQRVDRAPRSVRPHRRRNQSSTAAATSIAIGTLSAALSAGGSASCTLTVGGSGSVTVNDAMLCPADSIASGAKVVVAKIDGTWYLIQTTCPC